MQKILLDTNVLLHGGAKEGFVCYPVLRELDHMKVAPDALGKRARDVIYDIYTNQERYPFIYKIQEANETVDDFLIRLCKEDDYELHTLDLSLFLKAKANQIKAVFDGRSTEDYTGVTYLTDETAAELFQNPQKEIGTHDIIYVADYPDNHYLIINDEAYKVYRKRAKRIKFQTIKRGVDSPIKPRNIEQQCLVDALHSDAPVVLATGLFGSGKSFLMLSYMMSQLADEKINKIVVVPNNSFVSDTREVAAVPGDLFEKEFMHLGPLIDLIGKAQVQLLVEAGKIEVLPVAVARGRNLENCIVWANEAQNLTTDHIKLLLGRIGEGARIFFDGDFKNQIDKKIFKNRNGLKLLTALHATEQSGLFATVRLQQVERSEVARLSDLLDKLE